MLAAALVASSLHCAKDPTSIYLQITVPASMETVQTLTVQTYNPVTGAVISSSSVAATATGASRTVNVVVYDASNTYRTVRIDIIARGTAMNGMAPILAGARVIAAYTEDAVMKTSVTLASGCRASYPMMGMPPADLGQVQGGMPCMMAPPESRPCGVMLMGCPMGMTCQRGDGVVMARCIPACAAPLSLCTSAQTCNESGMCVDATARLTRHLY